MKTKILLVGASGIGSWFASYVDKGSRMSISGYEDAEFTVIDKDVVEKKNFQYTTYDVEHEGLSKIHAIASMYGTFALKAKEYWLGEEGKKDEDLKFLKSFDLICLCVDNNAARNIVFESDVPFIDMRSLGRSYFAMFVDNVNRSEYPTLTPENGLKGSCQDEKDLKDGTIQAGNIIAASLGYQFLLNYLRRDPPQGRRYAGVI